MADFGNFPPHKCTEKFGSKMVQLHKNNNEYEFIKSLDRMCNMKLKQKH